MADPAALLGRYASGGNAVLLLALGARTGLFDAFGDDACTPDELAARAGTDPVNTREWLSGLVAAGLVTEDGARCRLVPELAASSPWRLWVDDLAATVSMFEPVAGAMRTGRGIAPETLAAAYAPAVLHMNDLRYERELTDWVEQVSGLAAMLGTGAAVHEIGAGSGSALAVLAARHPRSRFVGHDLDPDAVRLATARLAAHPNASVVDRALGAGDRPDVVLAFDTLHHLPDPERSVGEWAAVLPVGGFVVVAEPTRQRAPVPDEHTIACATAALFYCLQDALGRGSRGHGNSMVPQDVAAACAAAGLAPVTTFSTAAGFTVSAARRVAVSS